MSFGPSGFVSVYDRLVLQHPLLNIIACLALVAGLASQLGNLKLDASSDSLVLEGDVDLQYFRESAKLYDSEEFLVVTFQPRDDLLSDASLATIEALRDELKALPGVSSVTTILDVPLLESPPVSLSDLPVAMACPG